MRRSAILHGLLCYGLTSAVPVLGAIFGYYLLDIGDVDARKDSCVNVFASQDGRWYKDIVANGYSYNAEEKSSVAFFPLYPLLARLFMRLTMVQAETALLIVSHTCLVDAFALAAAYAREKAVAPHAGFPDFVLLSMGLMPATLFFRMTYSEPLFLLLTLLALMAISRQRSLLLLAFVVGLSTAARPVGVALLVPFILSCWRRTMTFREFATKTFLLVPIACWGICAYALYQGIRFGDPFAFVKTQCHWGTAAVSPSEKLLALFTYEPILNAYNRLSPAYWGAEGVYPQTPLFSWTALNPVYFLLTAVLIVLGTWKGWLNSYEASMGGALLLIPYFTRAYEMSMASHARFAAVVFPVYLVLGHILVRLPTCLAAGLLAVSAFYLGAFSAMFASGYGVF